MTYDNQAAVLQSKYDYSACSLGVSATGALACGGSGTAAKNGAGGEFEAFGGPNESQLLFDNTVDGKTGAFRQFGASDLYNFGPLNYQVNPNERYTAGGFLNYEVNDHATVYGEVMFTRNTSTSNIAASGDFFTATFIPCTNPELTPDAQATICTPGNIASEQAAGLKTSETVNGVNINGITAYIGRRNVEGGPRIATFDKDSFRAVVGVKGPINDAWNYDVSYQHGTVDDNNGNLNYFNSALVVNALNTIGVNSAGMPVAYGTPGAIANCAVSSGDSKCVPYNVWAPNGVTHDAINYLTVPLLVSDSVTEQIVDLSFTGDLAKYGIKLPMAEDGLLLNIGAEYRSEYATFNPDYLSEQGNAEGSGGPTTPVSDGFHVIEGFTELSVPIVQHRPLFESLSLDAGYRFSSYSLDYDTNATATNPQTESSFNTSTYKFGVEWSPDNDLRFRASYQRAVRAPNVNELFGADSVQLDGSTDPCAGTKPNATMAQCALTGVTAAQYGHVGANAAAQYNGFTGGNPNLQPEVADTYSAGIVFKPTYVQGFTASVDYFNIDIRNVIGQIGGDEVLNLCIASNDVNSQYCQDVHRGTGGTLYLNNSGFVVDTLVNFGEQGTRGIDYKANYRLPLGGYGDVVLDFVGTQLNSLFFRPTNGGSSYDCAGFYGAGCGTAVGSQEGDPAPHWRHVFNTTWNTPWHGLNLGLRWRYIGSVDSILTSSNPLVATSVSPPGSAHIPAFSYIDLNASIELYKGIRMQVGVNNLFDKDPPVIDDGGPGFGSNCPVGACNGNTFPGVYDALGRYIFAHVTAEF
jgi:outer membrane receptor protein involved in Fe transport